MKTAVYSLLFAIAHCLMVVRADMPDLEKAFTSNQVVPDVIATVPKSLLKVSIRDWMSNGGFQLKSFVLGHLSKRGIR